MKQPTPEELADYLRYLAYAGACDRYGIDPGVFEIDRDGFEEAYDWSLHHLTSHSVRTRAKAEREFTLRNRIDHELDVIIQAGFPGYFLIVADLLRFCRQRGIPTGPGRGSVCGSAVAYATGITDVDPLRWGIPFERFLHLERVAMPDVDLDVCQARRGEVIEYLRERYGQANVAQIMTFGTLMARGVVRDVCRVLHVDDHLGRSNGETADMLARLIPEGSGADQVKLAAFIATDEGRPLRELIEDLVVPYNGEEVSVLDTCLRLEGTRKSSSVHPAGVVIADRPLDGLVPLCRRNRGDEVQTQFDYLDVEKVGLLKFDILGLRTMTVIGDAEAYVREVDSSFAIKAVPLDDPAAYELLAAGDTVGIFQLEGEGFVSTLRGLKPDRFEDVVALLALYRPGPIEQIPHYIHRKHGEEEVGYPHPDLVPVLEPTYGLIVYQEQVMGIARVMAGYSPGEADLFRKAIGKKLPRLIAEQIEEFSRRALGRGYTSAVVKEVGALIAYFGRYGWNLGHSTGYAYITYWTAYLKANYPHEFFAALLNSYMDKPAEMGQVLRDAKRRGLTVLPPDVNYSGRGFTIAREGDGGPVAIQFGFEAIRGLGGGAALDILEERDGHEKNVYSSRPVQKFREEGAYAGRERITQRVPNEPREFGGAWDFCRRLPHVPVNLKTSLAIAGAFSTDTRHRRLLAAAMPDLNKTAKKGKAYDWTAFEGDTMSELELIRAERETLGFYVTSHPLEIYADQLGMYGAVSDGEFSRLPRACSIAGLVMQVRIKQSKNGEMAWLKLENGVQGMPDVTVFADVWSSIRRELTKDAVVIVRGYRDDHPKFGIGFKAEHVEVLNRSRPSARIVRVVLPEGSGLDDIDMLAALLDEMGGAKGPKWQLALRDGKRAALLACRHTPIPTGAMLSALQEMGWTVRLDAARSDPVVIGGDTYAAGDGYGRVGVWELPLVEYAAETLPAKVIAELRRR